MGFKKNIFTVREISLHVLNQVILADADFQINQRNAWLQMGKSDETFAGFSKLSSLFLNEIDYSFELMPAPPSWWDKLKQFFGIRLKSDNSYYAIATANPTPSNLKIKISIKRDSPGKYDSEIATTPETPLKPEEINVIGFIK